MEFFTAEHAEDAEEIGAWSLVARHGSGMGLRFRAPTMTNPFSFLGALGDLGGGLLRVQVHRLHRQIPVRVKNLEAALFFAGVGFLIRK